MNKFSILMINFIILSSITGMSKADDECWHKVKVREERKTLSLFLLRPSFKDSSRETFLLVPCQSLKDYKIGDLISTGNSKSWNDLDANTLPHGEMHKSRYFLLDKNP